MAKMLAHSTPEQTSRKQSHKPGNGDGQKPENRDGLKDIKGRQNHGSGRAAVGSDIPDGNVNSSEKPKAIHILRSVRPA